MTVLLFLKVSLSTQFTIFNLVHYSENTYDLKEDARRVSSEFDKLES